MKKRIIILLSILLLIAVTTQFYQHAYGLGIKESNTTDNDNYVKGENLFVITNTPEGGFLVKAETEGETVEDIVNLSSYAVGTEAVAVCKGNYGPCVLLSVQSELDGEEITVYNILQLDENNTPVYMTDWFAPDRESTPADFENAADGFMLYFISDGNKYIYTYPLDATKVRELDENYLQDKREVTLLEVSDVTPNDGTLDMDSMSGAQYGQVFGRLSFKMSQIAMINHSLLINCITAMIIGEILLILLYIIMRGRNRYAYLILVWEILLAIMLIFQEVGTDLFTGKVGRTVTGITSFVVFSCFGIAVIVFMSYDLAVFTQAMNRLALGDTEIRKPSAVGEDMESMWNGLLDVCRIIRNVNYKRFKLYENYYRFAPKNIETFFGKKSIAEIQSGDSVRVKGNVAVIRYFARYDKADNLSQAVNIISSYQENGLCSLVGCMTDLTRMTIAFTPECKDSVAMLSNIVRASGGSISVFVHNIEYTYKIVGNDTQQIPYIVSEQMSELKTGIEVFEHLRLGLVITKEVAELDEALFDTRYIGVTKGEDSTDLYEVLDVLPAGMRRDIKDYDDIFQNGLRLMKGRDFYLARNEFARIIKKNPRDEVAKWYLFRAEQFLNAGSDEEKDFSIV